MDFLTVFLLVLYKKWSGLTHFLINMAIRLGCAMFVLNPVLSVYASHI